MPNPHAFIDGFNVYEGLTIGYFELVHLTIEHNTIVRYHNYEYPMTFEFRKINRCNIKSNEIDTLINAFHKYTSGSKIINSEYGNPYECVFGTISLKRSNNDTVIFQSTGTSERIYR